jgi:hypothetical protein
MPEGLDSERWTICSICSTKFVMVLALNKNWVIDINIMFQRELLILRVSGPYSFYTDPDPDPAF